MREKVPPSKRYQVTSVSKLRGQRGWSQEVMAEKAGLSVSTIHRIETSGNGTLKTVRLIAESLGRCPEDLIIPKSTSLLTVLMNEKGGVGRTTICLNLAALQASLGYRVCCVQISRDSSGLHDCCSLHNPGLPEISLFAVSDPSEIEDWTTATKPFSNIFIDGIRGNLGFNRVLFEMADLVIIPIQPSPLDISATVLLLRQLSGFDVVRTVPIILALNGIELLHDRKYLRQLEQMKLEYNHPMLVLKLFRREIYQGTLDSKAPLLSVFDLPESRDSRKAVREITEFWHEAETFARSHQSKEA